LKLKEEKKLIENAIIAYYNYNSDLNNVGGMLKEVSNCGCLGLFVLSAGSLILHESQKCSIKWQDNDHLPTKPTILEPQFRSL
jgi:hypothetical protein